MDKKKSVLIIKNISLNERVTEFAEQSYKNKQRRYYTNKNPKDIKILKEVKKDLNQKDYILLIIDFEMDEEERETINKIFIGTDICVEDDNKLKYMIKTRLTRELHQIAIESIVDKIDLDLKRDFSKDNYMMVSQMESLYNELRERNNAHNKCKTNDGNVSKNVERKYELRALAQQDNQSLRIYDEDSVNENSSEFQRDRERVVNCKAFRRLVDKAQIFGSEKGDYYRTRMTHSLEVNQIAKAISYALNLNLDLTEAIALGHDLGHTPFGHQGERTLDNILSGNIDVGIVMSQEFLNERCFGGFKHNYQSARVLTQLEEKYINFPGLNVSVQVVEGVLKHTKLDKNIDVEDFLPETYIKELTLDKKKEEQVCATLEGQVVAIADEIAQRGHDVDDALTSKVLSIAEFLDRLKINKCIELNEIINKELEDVEKADRVLIDKQELKIARIVSCIIDYMIKKTIEESEKNIRCAESDIKGIDMRNSRKIITFSDEVRKVNDYLEKVVRKKVICNSEVARADYNANTVVKALFTKYYENPRLLHAGTIHKIFVETLSHPDPNISSGAVDLADGDVKLINKEIKLITQKELFGEDIQAEKDEKEKIIEENKQILRRYIDKGEYSEEKVDMIIIFEKRRILVRAIVDYIAGMTDGYALEEYEKIR